MAGVAPARLAAPASRTGVATITPHGLLLRKELTNLVRQFLVRHDGQLPVTKQEVDHRVRFIFWHVFVPNLFGRRVFVPEVILTVGVRTLHNGILPVYESLDFLGFRLWIIRFNDCVVSANFHSGPGGIRTPELVET